MRADVVTMDVTIGALNDGDRTVVLCASDDFPEFVGHGATEADATQDLCDQLEAITWH